MTDFLLFCICVSVDCCSYCRFNRHTGNVQMMTTHMTIGDLLMLRCDYHVSSCSVSLFLLLPTVSQFEYMPMWFQRYACGQTDRQTH